MKVKSSKVLYFEKCPLFSKTTVKRNIITQFFSILRKYTVRYSSYEKYSCFVLLQKTLALKFRQCCMFPWFYFGTVYQTKSRSLNNIMASAAQTVISNVHQRETRETNKITRVITSAPYTANTQSLSSGTV